ncbi:MAG: AbrB/MazE/SpoVT family DNA-binding domain-containing protein [Desulfurococcales archaeon]|nr:AbrB/MazE/SpoVT family DNA-binding domain-containing protein [Desulfurococcales archaeon]
MPIRRRVHVGQVYLGREVLGALGIRDGDEVELEIRGSEAVIRSVKAIDKDTLDLIRLLGEVKASGGREDYFEEYDYEDISG